MLNRIPNYKNRPQILLVEDNEDLSWIIQIILEQRNFRVESLSSPESALSKIKTHRYELIISDYKLPIMSGLDFLEELHKLNNLTPVIMISAYANIALKTKAKELGAYAFLDKPFDIEELVEAINEALTIQKRRGANGCLRTSEAFVGQVS